jgi:predicted PurR-regulated permease PerM
MDGLPIDGSPADRTDLTAMPAGGRGLPPWVARVGLGAWTFVGLVAATVIVCVALAAVSEIVLPLTLAAVLAVVFRPAVGRLERHRMRSTYAAGLVVTGLLALVGIVVVATVQGVVEQASQIGAAADDALDQAAGEVDVLGVDRGRTVMSAIVSVVIGLASLLLGLPLVFTIMVVNLIGGYIPYIGAFLGGGLAIMVALGEGGLDAAAVMVVAVLAANLLLENFVEPRVMGRTLDIHPLTVLIVTALGGIVGGIVGLILAVPTAVIVGDAVTRLRSRGFFQRVAERAEPTVQHMLR